ncbi:MAG: beta-ketoacyl-[acyl-carrier-protein] synthase II [Anaerolineales bacterium]|nr:MAG: beta-ketoacyl-[acyl-carrier-protein] synthase II [Anaerolineales bacterium]
MSYRRVVITGLGCISPLGNDIQSTWEAVLAGESGVGLITHFDTTDFRTRIAAEVKGFDPVQSIGKRLARRTDRFTQFALEAAAQAIHDSELSIDDGNRDRIGVIIGSGIGGVSTLINESWKYLDRGPKWVSPHMIPMMLPDSAPGYIAIAHGLRGPNMTIVTACASSANAIGEATEMIRRGAADAILAGGAEAAIVPVALAGFNSMNAISTRNDAPTEACRPFDLERDGFIMGEGAACLVLESYEIAHARGAKILAEVIGYGATSDAFHMTAPAENGIGAGICMQNTLANAGLAPEQIDYINAHGTSTKLNDVGETQAIKATFGEHAYHLAVSSTKSMTGHLLGAAGALESIFCIQALQHNVIPPTINHHTPDPECDLDYVPNDARQQELTYVMTNSFGFGGHNACLIFGKV